MKVRKRKKLLITAAIIALIALIALFFGNAIYKSLKQKYLYSNYPIKYQTYVEKYSEEKNIDKFLIYAIIKTESDFNPDAVSNVGARGLMQIMEETFDWIRFRLKDSEELSYELMFDPEQNIRYGCYLIGYLINYFEDTDAAICAYHAGIGSVSSWLKKSELSEDGKTLDKIPNSDTEHYLRKVKKALSNYCNLYTEVKK